jgi:hypothetical protein
MTPIVTTNSSPAGRVKRVREASGGGTFAALPGARLTTFKAWANPIPNWSSIISAGRSVTVGASTEAALQSAINTAAAQTGGHRLVIVPDGFNARCNIIMPTNADPAYDVIIAWASVVNGSYSIARNTRITQTAPANMPLLETKSSGASNEDAIFDFQQSASICRFKVYGLHLRVASAASGDRYCFNLVAFGSGARPSDPAATATYACFSHCIMGGRKFDGSGNWRTGNLGRTVYDNASGLALLDSWDVEHGSTGGGGSDRGIWNGITSQGPVWIRNIATDYGGGICFMHGGGDCPDSYPNCEDVEIEYNYIVRDQLYNPNNTGSRLLDASSSACPWANKNQFETKVIGRLHAHHNVFIGQWGDGQPFAVAFKSANQDGSGKADATYDITFENNLIVSGRGSIGCSSAEGYSGGTIYGLRRFSVLNNVFVSGLNTTYPSSSGGRGDSIRISYKAGTATEPVLSGDHQFEGNYFELSAAESADGHQMYLDQPASKMGSRFFVKKNVWAHNIYTFGLEGTSGGMNAVFDAAQFDSSIGFGIADNCILSTGGTAPAGDSTYAATQFYRASKATMGISDGALVGERTQAGDSFLIAGASDGSRIGPVFATINTNRTAVAAGVIV